MSDPIGRCDCGGTIERSSVFPVEMLAEAERMGREFGADVIAFGGCRKCGGWSVHPAVKMPESGNRQGKGNA